MSFVKLRYYGNTLIGLFFRANDSVVLIPKDTLKSISELLEKTLEVNVIKVSIGLSNLNGAYVAMNNNGVILPQIVKEDEIRELKKAGLNVYISKDKNNAFGNNLCINDKGGIANPHISNSELKKIEDFLGIEIVKMKINNYSAVGAVCATTNKGFLVHYSTSDEELKKIERILKVKGVKGSINMGLGFVGSAIVANSKGFAVGEESSGYEIGIAESALGYI